jgi:uncharacterized peroxidase-related enzyme
MNDTPGNPPRLRPLGPDEVPEVKDIFDSFLKERGNIPNMFRTIARRDSHLRTMIDHFRTVMNEGTVPRLLKEFISVRVSAINDCEYWLDSHTALAARLGGSQTQIEALVSGKVADAGFSEEELAALSYAEALTLDSNAVPDSTFAALGEHYDEGETIEISLVAGLFNYFNLVNNALRTEPTR